MSFDAGAIVGKVILDTKEWSKSITKVGKDTSGLANMVKNNAESFRSLGLAIGGLGIAILGVSGVMAKLGSDAGETQNKMDVAFGSMASSARDWAEGLSSKFDLNAIGMGDMASTLYLITNSMGVTKDAAFKMSTGLTELATDIGSLYNLSTEDAFEKIRAGITGETEPLKSLGIVLSQTTLEQQAMIDGVHEGWNEMTEATKVTLRYNAIMRLSEAAHGDFGNTMDSTANIVKRLKAALTETAQVIGQSLSDALGKVLTPVMNAVHGIKEFVKAHTVLVGNLALGVTGFAGLATVVGGSLLSLSKAPMIFRSFGSGLKVLTKTVLPGFRLALSSAFWPITIIGATISAAVLAWKADFMGVRTWFKNKFGNWSTFFFQVSEKIKAVLGNFFGVDTYNWPTMWAQIWEKITYWFDWAYLSIKAVFYDFEAAFWDFAANNWDIVDKAKSAYGILTDTVVNTMADIMTGIDYALNAIGNWWDENRDWILETARELWDGLKKGWSLGTDFIVSTIRVVLDAINGDWNAAWRDASQFVERSCSEIEEYIERTFPTLLKFIDKMDAFVGYLSDIKAGLGMTDFEISEAVINRDYSWASEWAAKDAAYDSFANGGVSSGGLNWAGEHGVELQALPSGTRTFSHGDTVEMLKTAFAGGDGMTVSPTINISGNPSQSTIAQIERAVLNAARKAQAGSAITLGKCQAAVS